MGSVRQLRAPMAALAALTLAVSACTGASVEPMAEPGGDEEARGGVDELIIAYSGDVDVLDPHQFKSVSAFSVVGNVYARLFAEEFDDGGDGLLSYTGDVVPHLAESAVWNEPRDVLTFTLRDDAAFSNGDPVLAEDVVYSLQRAVSEISYGAAIGRWLNITDAENDVRAIDERTVELEVTHYSPLIEPFLAFPIFPILDKSTADEMATDDDPWAMEFFTDNATESGPYIIASHDGPNMTLVKNPEFTALDISDAPEQILIQSIPDPQQAYLALQNGAVDVVHGLTPDIAASVDEADDLALYRIPLADIVYIGFNSEDEILQDARVRRAISHVIPYEALREDVTKGYSHTAYGPTPYPMTHALDDSGEQVAYSTDVEAARALLEDAGYEEGELSLTLSVPSSEQTFRQAAVFIQSALAEIGVAVSVEEMNDAEFNSNLGQMQMYINSWFSYGQDSVYQMFFLLTTGQFTNYTNFSNPEFDELIESAMATTDPGEREEYSQAAQQLAIDEAPWAYLYTRETLIGTRSGVTGITHANDGTMRYELLRVSE